MKQCPQCQQATIELALIKNEIDGWLEADKEGLGELSAGPRIRRIAKRFEGFELLAHAAENDQPARLELSFPPDRAWVNPRELLELGNSAATPAPARRNSMSTLFEFRTRNWVKWLVLPIAWALSVLVAWWVLH